MKPIETTSSPRAIYPQPLPAFPLEGKTRAKQNAAFLGIGTSTFWMYVKEGRIKQPMKYGARVSVWDAGYIRGLAENGIPKVEQGEGVTQ